MKIIIEINESVKMLNVILDNRELVHYSRYKNILTINAKELFLSESEKFGKLILLTKTGIEVFTIIEMSSSDPDASVIRCHILNH